MSHSISLLVEFPSPLSSSVPMTSLIQDTFTEQVLLRTLPLIDNTIKSQSCVGLVFCPSSIYALSKVNWTSAVDDLIHRLGTADSEVYSRLNQSRMLLSQSNGSAIELLKKSAGSGYVRLIAQPLVGLDICAWISHPGVATFHFEAIQKVFEASFEHPATDIALLRCGYASQLNASLAKAGFNLVYVANTAFDGAHSKLQSPHHRPVLDPATGVALCEVDTSTFSSLLSGESPHRCAWRNMDVSAILKDPICGISTECYSGPGGMTAPYDTQQAVAALQEAILQSFVSIKRGLTRGVYKQVETLTVLWCPNRGDIWWEEAFLGFLFKEISANAQLRFEYAHVYLQRCPELETSWLGTVTSEYQDLTAYAWFPRRFVYLFEWFRRERQRRNWESEPALEQVARLLFFASVATSVFQASEHLPFPLDQSPKSLLEQVEGHLEKISVTHLDSRPSLQGTEILNWAQGTLLLSAPRT